jgi:hypothetical protein
MRAKGLKLAPETLLEEKMTNKVFREIFSLHGFILMAVLYFSTSALATLLL